MDLLDLRATVSYYLKLVRYKCEEPEALSLTFINRVAISQKKVIKNRTNAYYN